MKTEVGVMLLKDGKAWGLAYEGGGHGDPSSDGWVPIENGKIYGEFVLRPTDVLPMNGRPDLHEKMRGAEMVFVMRETRVIKFRSAPAVRNIKETTFW